MAMSPEMRMYTNRNRVISVTQKHEREWTNISPSRLINGYGTSFVYELDNRITVDFLSYGFITIKWLMSSQGIYHWSIAPYEGKMYRNLVTMSSNLIRNRTRGNSQIIYGVSLIPMERLISERTMHTVLYDVLLYGERSSVLPSNWNDIMIFPDSVVMEAYRRAGIVINDRAPADLEPESLTLSLGPNVPIDSVSSIFELPSDSLGLESSFDLTFPIPENNTDNYSEDEIESVPTIPIRKIRI